MALDRVLRAASARPRSILDYGCGDGFTGEHLFSKFGAERMLGFDINLSNEQCAARSRDQISYSNRAEATEVGGFDLCLLCDVIEHVADDRALLESVRTLLAGAGLALITVPAFQSLFTSHDRALRHYRRYTLPELESVIAAAGFDVISSGYLFASLLPARGISKLLEWVAPKPTEDFGIGAWSRSPATTRAVELVLNLDNALLLHMAALNIKLPGLSAWTLCTRR